MANNKIKLKIYDTNRGVLFDGEVDQISSYNEVGPFDIYVQHANFISIIKKGLTLFNNKQKLKEIEFEQAVLKIKKDLASIFLGIEIIDLGKEQIENLPIQNPQQLTNHK